MANSRREDGAMDERLAGYLKTRRTIPAAQMAEPGPDPAALRAMLTIAARVPDHGKLAPWRFIVFERQARGEVIAGLTRIAEAAAEEKERRQRADAAKSFGDAPLVVAVVSAPIADHPKIPLWEQQLSAGAVCLNLVHAAWAHGFAAQWLTGWFAYDEEARAWLGLRPGERVAGFIHVGTPKAPPSERDRPDVDAITEVWRVLR
jgi:nitroreductase